MEKDLYALNVERAIFNWYHEGKNAGYEAIFNEMVRGFQNGMQVMLPVEIQDGFSEKNDKQSGEKQQSGLKNTDGKAVKSRLLTVSENGKYYVPLFTGESEMKKGESSPFVLKNMKTLFEELRTRSDCLGIAINPWDKILILSKELIDTALNYRAKSHISITRGSVLDMHVGAIVNAARNSLLGGGGVDGAIHHAAGPGLLNECRKLHGCETGKAKITGSYNLTNADFIIHTVGPVYSGSEKDAELLAGCYRNSLDLALKNECTSIAFPCISTGAYGYPITEAAETAAETVSVWISAHPDAIMNVYFCCFKDSEYDAYTKLFK